VQQRVVLGRDGQVREQRVAVRAAGLAFDAGDAWWLRRRLPPEVLEPRRHGRARLCFDRHAASNGHIYTHDITKLKKLKIKKYYTRCRDDSSSCSKEFIVFCVD